MNVAPSGMMMNRPRRDDDKISSLWDDDEISSQRDDNDESSLGMIIKKIVPLGR